MEIQKAEEFADHIRALPVLHEQFSGLSTLIRARDEAIIERCKEAIKGKYSRLDELAYCDGVALSLETLDSILRELEGGA